MVEKELGQPLERVFSEFGSEPVAAASLAQVYRARLRDTGEEVAVKVQRPGALSTISKGECGHLYTARWPSPPSAPWGIVVAPSTHTGQTHKHRRESPALLSARSCRTDLYVMRRATVTYEKLVRKFTAQTTDFQSVLSTFAEGLYTEMDFRNEALNAQRMRELLGASGCALCDQVVIPQPHMRYTTRRVLVMEWVPGVKLTRLPPEEIRELVPVGQAAFLTQLLDMGFIHGDPHPGNILKVREPIDMCSLSGAAGSGVAAKQTVRRDEGQGAALRLRRRR